MHETLDEEQTAYVVTAVSESRRRPYCTRTADAAEGSRRAVAVARSRRCEAIAMRNAAEREQNNSKCTIQNSELIEFSSKAQFHRCHSEAKPKNRLISNIHFSCARPSRPRAQGLPYQKEPAGHACRNVMLSESNRRTQRAQRPLADYASQGGERQTQCSQESMRDNRESDSSSIFRSPQNDELLLNCEF